MLFHIESIFIIVFEILCCKIFYETFGQKRYPERKFINVVQIFLLCAATILSAYMLRENFIVRQLFHIVIISVIMCWHIAIDYRKSVFLVLLFEGFMLSVDYMAFVVNTSQHYGIEELPVIIVGKTLLFACVVFVRKEFDKKTVEMLPDSARIKFLFFPVFTIVVISEMLSGFKYTETSRLLSATAIGLVGLNIVVLYLIKNTVERETRISEYRSILENFDRQKRKTHEYKNQIICIASMLGKKQYSELEAYVKKIYGNINDEVDAINTNNVIVNAILNTKYQEAVKKGMVFVFKVNDLSDLGMSDEDVVTVLANLLNNAIEACEKCTEKKIIKFKFIKEDAGIIIAVKNTFQDTICYENGEIKTTKSFEAEEHGVGIKNIIRTVEKYGGSYVIQEKDKEFYFSIMIPLQNAL
ncbi:MAG: sensor histidine kinase [Lachnospiraceae bacterium]|nr:sensor histidine kinase [Lachnospiraceae bacterium]